MNHAVPWRFKVAQEMEPEPSARYQNMSKFYGNASSEKARSIYEDSPIDRAHKPFELGEFNTSHLLGDPRRVGFMFARYKFGAKMLQGRERVLEIGCQEGLGSLVLAQAVGQLVATDFFKDHIESCLRRYDGRLVNIEFRGHDILAAPVEGGFDGALSLDVFEHIDPAQEHLFLGNVAKSLTHHGVFVLGTPSLESQVYASPGSKHGHINCKSGEDLRKVCQDHFHLVFMFGMNDEVLHTGFLPMAHYLLALCTDPK
jgi:2-polyprenyl-3-methyl-5-hydroxy-6-metoxy-1,4-benzoquinol methylase